jgi:hypothetical protein
MQKADFTKHLPATTDFQDVTLTCCDCSEPFIWTAGQQLYFRDRGLREPRRCAECIGARRCRFST